MRLKDIRKKLHLSQSEVAEKVGITQKTYSNYENGITQPNYAILAKIAECLNVPINTLTTNEKTTERTIDQQQAIKMLLALNQLNFIKAYSYISGLYAAQG